MNRYERHELDDDDSVRLDGGKIWTAECGKG